MSTGFKEWAVICEALGRGEQSILVRKGGIAEGRDGFRFQHDAFYLFPTWFHEQIARTKLPPGTPLPERPKGTIVIRYFAKVEWTRLVTEPSLMPALAPFHLWNDEVVSERFHYDTVQGMHVAFLRIYKLSRPWELPDGPQYGGCRSWVELPDAPADIGIAPVLDDAAHHARAKTLQSAMDQVTMQLLCLP